MNRRRHPIRVLARLVWMGEIFCVSAADFLFSRAGRSKETRGFWLQRTASRFLPLFGIQPHVKGAIPTRGLLVSNHLSYMDIVVLASLTPAVFVAKREVRSWPLFGWFATMGGSLYVNRARRTQVGEFAAAIQTELDRGALVILFPEGTSSGGQNVLPFKSSLLEPAARDTHPLAAGLIQYQLDDGDVSEEVCYWKDMTLLPHLLNLLSKRRVGVEVRFAPVEKISTDRKEVAQQLHTEVLRLRERSLPAEGFSPTLQTIGQSKLVD